MALRKAAGGDGKSRAQQQQQGGGWLGWLRGAAGGGGRDGQQHGGGGGGAAGAGQVLEADMGSDEWQKLAELAMQSEVGRGEGCFTSVTKKWSVYVLYVCNCMWIWGKAVRRCVQKCLCMHVRKSVCGMCARAHV
jgi:hypothetical protein